MHPLLTPKLTNATIRRAVRDYLNGGAIDGGAPADLVALMQRCWDHEPDARPTFAAIKAELRGGPDTPAR